MTMIINSPFPTKQGLKIASEIARYELTSEQIERINNFISILDNSHNRMEVTCSEDLMYDIKECVRIFKNSDTIYWTREDFIKELLYFENL